YNGRKVVGGFAGHFLATFSRKHNFSLYEPLPISSYTQFAPAQDLIAAVRNNTVEISAAHTFPTGSFEGFSYPFEQVSWCVCTPVEADIPNYKFFWIVFERFAFVLVLGALVVISLVLSCALWQHGNKPSLLHFFLHGACFRGVLGQSAREICGAPFVIRFIYLQIYIFGILLTTSYNSHFASYWTSAPKEQALQTFDDILHSNWKIYVFSQELEAIKARKEWRKYIPMFQTETNYQTFLDALGPVSNNKNDKTTGGGQVAYEKLR
ncbi:uncharacterized protein LOC129253343, partial [Anastrepha obliqua]|uniref:uncharacterized protein LOC129253343 n=1 Tax=Anastrepha obliqua TaxID=95512 RepID=UPI002409673B